MEETARHVEQQYALRMMEIKAQIAKFRQSVEDFIRFVYTEIKSKEWRRGIWKNMNAPTAGILLTASSLGISAPIAVSPFGSAEIADS